MSGSIKVKDLLDNRFTDSVIYGIASITTKHQKASEIGAEDFHRFAIEDSKGRDLRSWVNALGNVKRAIECQIDTLLFIYCLHKKSQKEKWDFPKKIDVIQQLGIVAPRILGKINKKRNELEHGYIKPTKDDVDDALDVAKLFLAYTDGIAYGPKRPIVSYGLDGDFEVQLERKKGFVKLVDYKNKTKKKAKINKDDGWIEFAKILVKLSKLPWEII